MSDKILETSQLVSGAAILLSFFVGYKYALRSQTKEQALSSGSGGAEEGEVITFFQNFFFFFFK